MSVSRPACMTLEEIENKLIEVIGHQLQMPPESLRPDMSLIEDLAFDSLEVIELFHEIEETFHVRISNGISHELLGKSIFTRNPLTIRDVAESVYIMRSSPIEPYGEPRKYSLRQPSMLRLSPDHIPFTQLGGVLSRTSPAHANLYELVSPDDWKYRVYRRTTDGMRCVVVPGGWVDLGSDSETSQPDQKPVHRAYMNAFLMDAEPVSTTAYCRFLNSIDSPHRSILREWFLLEPGEHRYGSQLIEWSGDRWKPVPETDHLPMVLVSWHGASAYALWANRRDWQLYMDESQCWLPSEAQWEYAARGPEPKRFPWGDAPATDELLCAGRHRRGSTYVASDMPMAPVQARLGMSPFGLHHMAGNIWQWCRDWYSSDFYTTKDATKMDPVNRQRTGVRSERGGSWVGDSTLCLSSYRRGRNPNAKGRCLGFRCVGTTTDL